MVKSVFTQYVKSFVGGKFRSDRLRTSQFRSMPAFIIVGAQKGGTTSLFYYIAQHPEFRVPTEPEIHYFDLWYSNGVSWYRSQFPLMSDLRNGELITGESSPYYLLHPHTPERIFNLFII